MGAYKRGRGRQQAVPPAFTAVASVGFYELELNGYANDGHSHGGQDWAFASAFFAAEEVIGEPVYPFRF